MSLHIRRAVESDSKIIADIGRAAVELSHRASCSEKDMNDFLNAYYNEDAILAELKDPANIYHVIFHGAQAAGFSKIILNAQHPNIPHSNATKLDRIYLDQQFYDLKAGYQLLNHNIALSKESNQCGMWLFTWTGNERAVNFYKRSGFEVIGSHKFKVTDDHYNPHHQMFLAYGV